MKKICLLLICILLLSCDKELLINYIMKNNTNNTILVSIIDSNGDNYNFSLESNHEYLFKTEYGLNKMNPKVIELAFTEIIVMRENEKSRIYYINGNLWEIVSFDKQADCYLTINSEDFE